MAFRVMDSTKFIFWNLLDISILGNECKFEVVSEELGRAELIGNQRYRCTCDIAIDY